MSKRLSCASTSANKRSKIDDDFWGDDLDGDLEEIENCFIRATQALQENDQQTTNDVNLLSSYSIFKKSTGIISSTQSMVNGNINERLTELENKYLEKEGEVSILRSNINNLRASCQVSEEKKEQEWKEKLNSVEKENKSVKSALEFKNLEIVNLKQQITELTRAVNSDSNLMQSSEKRSKKSPEKTTNIIANNFRIYIGTPKFYPLKKFSNIFEFLNYSLKQDEIFKSYNKHPLKTLFLEPFQENNINIFCDKLISIINLSTEELNVQDINCTINEIIIFAFQMFSLYYDHYKGLEENSDVTNLHYLYKNSIKQFTLSCTEILKFLTALLQFCDYSATTLITENSIDYNYTFVKLKSIAGYLNKNKISCNFVILLSHIVQKIVHNKMEQNCNKFLLALVDLVGKIFEGHNFENAKTSSKKLVSQILSINLNSELIQHLSYAFTIITRSSNLIYSLCEEHEKDCRILKFITLMDDIVSKDETNATRNNVLKMTYNIFRVGNNWMESQEKQKCKCINNLFKLAVKITYKDLMSSPKDCSKNNLRVLALLAFHQFDLTQKYITDLAQFKEVVYKLNQSQNEEFQALANKLEKLGTSEEVFEVPREKFNAINF